MGKLQFIAGEDIAEGDVCEVDMETGMLIQTETEPFPSGGWEISIDRPGEYVPGPLVPDTKWVERDENGHLHKWNPQSGVRLCELVEEPRITFDGDDWDALVYRCTKCGVEVEPGYKRGPDEWKPGLTTAKARWVKLSDHSIAQFTAYLTMEQVQELNGMEDAHPTKISGIFEQIIDHTITPSLALLGNVNNDDR